MPAVASWDTAGSRGQARSTAFIDDICTAVAERVADVAAPLACCVRCHSRLTMLARPMRAALAERSSRAHAQEDEKRCSTTDEVGGGEGAHALLDTEAPRGGDLVNHD